MSNTQPSQEPKRRWVLLGIPLCIFMGLLQFDRALGGNQRSWMYVFEWPFFALFLFYMYWKLQQPQDPYDDSNDPQREIK
jgi:uncharacterized membrane protein